jgi:hypothetical protein
VTAPTWSTLSIDTRLALRTAAARLTDEFTGTFGPETIERFLHSSYDQFAQQGYPPRADYRALTADRPPPRAGFLTSSRRSADCRRWDSAAARRRPFNRQWQLLLL